MSLLPQNVHVALSQLLLALASADNIVRAQAEEQLNNEWVKGRPDVLLIGLAEQLQGAEDAGTRSFAAVLFRRISTRSTNVPDTSESKELFFTLSKEQRVAIREKLLESLGSESLAHVRNKIGDAVAEIAGQYADNGEQWSELLGVLFQASQSTDPGMRDSAFRIFSTTPGIIEKQHEEMVVGVFAKGFRDENISVRNLTFKGTKRCFLRLLMIPEYNYKVRISAMEAFSSFFRSVTKKSQSKFFSLVPDVLNILPPLKEADESDELSKAFISLIELAEVCPKMFKGLFNNLVKFSISVIGDKELSDQVRQNALELMATFADYSPKMCQNDPTYPEGMVTQCLSLMTDVGLDDEDATDWTQSEDLDLEESDKNHVAGEQCMDRLANKLGGKVIVQATFSWVPRMMSSTSWRDRHAALMAISAISEGCRDLMEGELGQVLALVTPALQDPHPRVRFAGCNALGQMSTDFAPTMQEKYHSIVLGNILPVLDSTEPRVQAHAAAALVNFCEEAEKEILEPYLEELLRRLLQLLRSPKRFVQEQALSTIATIADSAEAAFGQFYDMLMPLLLNVLNEEQSKEFRILRAKAMECATLIALAVGKEKMGQDALTLVQLLGNIQQNITDADDPQSSYLLHCWGRMCRVLNQDFVPYLPGVMPPLLQVAAAKADVQILDDEEQFKQGLAFFFHDPVRVSSANLIPQLLNSYKKAHGDQAPEFLQMWSKTADKLIEVLSAEPAIDTLAEMFQCFYESVEVAGKNSLTPVQMQAFIESAKSSLEDYQERVNQRLEANAELEDGDDDAYSYNIEIEEDQNLLSDMNKAFHIIFKNHGPAFLPAWEQLLPCYDAFIISQDPTQRQWGICIMDDLLEFCGEQSWNYKDHIIHPLLNGMRDENAANRQAACYGVGMAAQKGGLAWSEFVAASIPTLFQATHHPKARTQEHIFATENASASIAKILHYNSSKVQNPQEVVENWFNTLPIINDEEAAPYAYSFLAQLIDQYVSIPKLSLNSDFNSSRFPPLFLHHAQNPVVFNNATKVFTFIVQALEAETLQGATAARVASSAKQLAAASAVNVDQIFANVNPKYQVAVRSFFQ
ncbi:karyopherin Sal3 [Histoplasma capsulatum]|uniref:Karyopherin Sal3 n=1 Tax=Ajellomyces capsulatus TaxID=5037 RepID=A0A8A1MAQ7_AJECA|nr:karyopherin Sal3 [Histoplasma capsulatum]